MRYHEKYPYRLARGGTGLTPFDYGDKVRNVHTQETGVVEDGPDEHGQFWVQWDDGDYSPISEEDIVHDEAPDFDGSPEDLDFYPEWTAALRNARTAKDAAKLVASTLENQGGTFDPVSFEPVEMDSGYFVSKEGGIEVPEDEFDESIVRGWLAANRLSPGDYIGTWIEDGVVYLDATRWFEDRQEALTFGRANHQVAAWDVAAGEVLPMEQEEEVIAKTAASVEYTLPPHGIHLRTHAAMKAAGLTAVNTYPGGISPDFPDGLVSNVPSQSAMDEMGFGMDAEMAGIPLDSITIMVETENLEAVLALYDQQGGRRREQEPMVGEPESDFPTLRGGKVAGDTEHTDVSIDNDADALVCPNCGSHTLRAFGVENGEANLKCLTCGNEFKRPAFKNPEASVQKEAPGKKHVEEWSEKRNRQYEHILENCKEEHPDYSLERCKELAAATVNKTRRKKRELKGGIDDEGNLRESIDTSAITMAISGLSVLISSGSLLASGAIVPGNPVHRKLLQWTMNSYGLDEQAANQAVDRAIQNARQVKNSTSKHKPGTRVQINHPKYKGQRGTILNYKDKNELDEEQYEIQLDSGDKLETAPESSFSRIKSAGPLPDTPENYFLESIDIEKVGQGYAQWPEDSPYPMDVGMTPSGPVEPFGDPSLIPPYDVEPDEEFDIANCPACEGPGMLLGVLGTRTHYRCRNCGLDFSRKEAATKKEWKDSAGESLQPGRWYNMHHREYTVPDKIRILNLESRGVEAEILNGEESTFPIVIESNDEYSFEPISEEELVQHESAAWSDGANTGWVFPQWPGAGPSQMQPCPNCGQQTVNEEGICQNCGYVSREPRSTGPAMLSKWQIVAKRDWSSTEQNELINENPTGLARNYDKLNLEGTHYVVRHSRDDDPNFLWGV